MSVDQTNNLNIKKFLSADNKLRASVVVTTDALRTMTSRQQTNPIATLALGRLATGAVLLASNLKRQQRVSLCVDANGALGQVYAEASFEGHVRGIVEHPQGIPTQEVASLGEAIGQGTMTVTTFLPGAIEPSKGVTPLVTGEIGDDLGHYLLASQQIGSVVVLAVALDHEGGFVASGGLLIEALPGYSEASDELQLVRVEKAIQKAGSLARQLTPHTSVDEIERQFLSSLNFVEIPHPYQVSFACQCSEERMRRSLALLGDGGAFDKSETPIIEGRCEFCGTVYRIPNE